MPASDFTAIEAPETQGEYWQHERAAALHDLAAEGVFSAAGLDAPYRLNLTQTGEDFSFALENEAGAAKTVTVPVVALVPPIRHYRRVCDNYYRAIAGASLDDMTAMDKARRDAHLAGGRLLIKALGDKAQPDESTARRLFTLLCCFPL